MNIMSPNEPGSTSRTLDKYVHTLSLRLTAGDYRRLRRFAAIQEDRLGRRITHQAVLEAALNQFLEAKAGSAPG